MTHGSGSLPEGSGAIGVVGLGTMGRPIVRVLAAHRPVVVFDVDPAAVRQATAVPGVTAVASVNELAAGEPVEAAILSLPNAGIVADVLDELAGVPLVLDTSTIGPDDSRAFAARLSPAGTDYLDCPILGRPASVGKWTVPAGGTPDQVERAAEVLAPVARVVGVGPVGAGATVKVLNNTMLGVINAATAEVLALAAAAGLDPGVFVDTVIDSGAASVSGLFRDVAPRAVDGDFAPVFSLGLMLKDSGLGVELARSHGAALAVAEAAAGLHAQAVEAGHGAEDSIAAVRVLEERLGVSVRRHGR